MITCGKSSCNHCEKVFDFKNKLHDYIRNKECQQSFIKSKSVNKIDLTLFFILEKNAISDANIAIINARIKYFTHITITSISAAKSIAPHKSDLSTFIHVENTSSKTLTISLTTSFFIYRAILSLSLTYKSYKKLYFTVVNLYIRYASLSKPSFNKVTRIIIVFFVMFMQNRYEKFYNKKK